VSAKVALLLRIHFRLFPPIRPVAPFPFIFGAFNGSFTFKDFNNTRGLYHPGDSGISGESKRLKNGKQTCQKEGII
jgi:hypothetical protein